MKRQRRIGLFSIAVMACATSGWGQISAGELWRPDPGHRDYFGSSMLASDDSLVVQSEARVDVYDVTTGEALWTQVLTLEDFPDSLQLSDLPEVLAVQGDWMVLGDNLADVGGIAHAGVAYLFRRGDRGWTFFERLTASTPTAWAAFGSSADLDDRTLAIGAPSLANAGGTAHLYERRGDGWEELHVLKGWKPDWRFGRDVAVDGDWLLVGAPYGWSGVDSEYSYVHFFHRESSMPGAPWTLSQTFPGQYGWYHGAFGEELALEGDYAVASDPGIQGGPGHDTFAFRKSAENVWVKSQVITSPHKFPGSTLNPHGFGSELQLNGRDLVLGSPEIGASWGSAGMAYHYRLIDSHWDYIGALLPAQQERIEFLGSSVALVNGRAYAGASLKGAIFDPQFGCCIIWGAAGGAYAFDLSVDAQQYCSCPTGSPCTNTDNHGGCANSTGVGGVLTSAGSGSREADDLRLQAFDLPQYQVAVLAIGTQAVAKPFGDGRLCVWGNVLHAKPETTGTRGQIDWAPGVAGLAAKLGAPIQPGELRHFQLFYRDPYGPCGTGINLTNAVRVDFKP